MKTRFRNLLLFKPILPTVQWFRLLKVGCWIVAAKILNLKLNLKTWKYVVLFEIHLKSWIFYIHLRFNLRFKIQDLSVYYSTYYSITAKTVYKSPRLLPSYNILQKISYHFKYLHTRYPKLLYFYWIFQSFKVNHSLLSLNWEVG